MRSVFIDMSDTQLNMSKNLSQLNHKGKNTILIEDTNAVVLHILDSCFSS